MSTLRVTGLKQETSTATNISLAVGGGVTVAGISTFYSGLDSDARLTVGGSNVTDSNLLTLNGSGATQNVGLVFNKTNSPAKAYGMQVNNPTGDLLLFDYSESAERMRVGSAGSVHIGPGGAAAQGHGLLTLTQSASAAFNALVVQQGSTGFNLTDGLHIGIDGGVNAYFKLYENRDIYFTTGTSNTEKLRITSAGNVGIGTDNPDKLLHVQASNANASSNAFDVAILERNDDCYLKILSKNDKVGGINFGDTQGSYMGALYYDHSVNGMIFNVNETEKVRISSSGNLGIGTNSPEEILHVLGPSQAVTDRDGVMLQNSTASESADTGLPLVWSGYVNSSNQNYGLASICGRKENGTAGNASAYLQFATCTSGGALTERLKINSLGQTLYYGESGNASGATATNQGVLSANGTLDLKIPGTTFVGHLYVTSVYSVGALTRTAAVYFVSARLNNGVTITALNSANGSSGGRTFTITEVSGGSFPNTLRFTDTSNSGVTVSMHFVGATGL